MKRKFYTLLNWSTVLLLILGLTSCLGNSPEPTPTLQQKAMFGQYKGSILVVKKQQQTPNRADDGPNVAEGKKDIIKEYGDMVMSIDQTIVVPNFPLDVIFEAIFSKKAGKESVQFPKDYTLEASYRYLPGNNFINVFLNPTPIRFKFKADGISQEDEVTAIIDGVVTSALVGLYFAPERKYTMGLQVRNIKVNGTVVETPVRLFYYLKFKQENKQKGTGN
ncbi:DUF4840 domain-containing protein [Porphyromonas sp.]|uniref:DUF4840 domain-containing protein n=1 Tax=Porphyromonas sp. TaxID=1924944 RepID=UPI0026DB3414|nr:DUF4840 domain-containing protein [Porphyromonas sp.]MDO4771228.1 DUF4840 domain-containing protein [Porphyromonas sp.]